MTKQNFWAVQAHTEQGKALCWNYKEGRTLYFTFDKKSPAPSLFPTKQEAVKAIGKSRKSREDHSKKLFRRQIDCKKASPVRININVLN